MLLMQAASRAWRSLWTPAMFGVICYTMLLTLIVLAGLVIAAGGASFYLASGIHTPWLAGLVGVGGTVGSAILAWLLFPGMMPLVVSFFDNHIADAIEMRDYAERPKADAIPFWPEIVHDIGFSLWAVFLNVICLPLYLVPGINLILFYLLNGYLLGREFFDMAARRHMPRAQAQSLRSAYGGQVFLGGVLLVMLASIPFVNLIAPFWGVALATHLFHLVYAPPIALYNANPRNATN